VGDTPSVTDLVRSAAEGDRCAWERLVDQYERLIWSITRDFKLIESDAADVAQVTWLRLLEHIDGIEQPERVGSWLATTARHECLRSLAASKRVVLGHEEDTLEGVAAAEPELDEGLLAAERAQTVRAALSCLPQHWQQLIELLMADPPVSYTEISDQLGVPVGSIGPTRARCLAKLREHLQTPEREAAAHRTTATTNGQHRRPETVTALRTAELSAAAGRQADAWPASGAPDTGRGAAGR
jgi:RNA polymerase sigma factor (sigma-70 family)